MEVIVVYNKVRKEFEVHRDIGTCDVPNDVVRASRHGVVEWGDYLVGYGEYYKSNRGGLRKRSEL